MKRTKNIVFYIKLALKMNFFGKNGTYLKKLRYFCTYLAEYRHE